MRGQGASEGGRGVIFGDLLRFFTKIKKFTSLSSLIQIDDDCQNISSFFFCQQMKDKFKFCRKGGIGYRGSEDVTKLFRPLSNEPMRHRTRPTRVQWDTIFEATRVRTRWG